MKNCKYILSAENFMFIDFFSVKVTLGEDGMFWEIGQYAPKFSAMYIKFSQESQTIADYENMNLVRKAKAAKMFKKTFLHDGFSTNLVHKTEFLNLGFCSIFFKF